MQDSKRTKRAKTNNKRKSKEASKSVRMMEMTLNFKSLTRQRILHQLERNQRETQRIRIIQRIKRMARILRRNKVEKMKSSQILIVKKTKFKKTVRVRMMANKNRKRVIKKRKNQRREKGKTETK